MVDGVPCRAFRMFEVTDDVDDRMIVYDYECMGGVAY